MKTPVATIERGDSRAMPQMPCPEVQPLLEPGAEADQDAGEGNGDEVRRHLWDGHGVADEHGRKGRRDQAGDEGRTPGAVRAGRVKHAGKDTGHAGDAAVEQQQQQRGKPDQRPADCCRDRSEIGHACLVRV